MTEIKVGFCAKQNIIFNTIGCALSRGQMSVFEMEIDFSVQLEANLKEILLAFVSSRRE